MNRMKMVYMNSIISFGSQLCKVFIGFWLRRIFIEQLGVTYLGYHSVFSNILQLLNLSDMGFSIAITSYLYKPLANRNHEQICALMYLYKRIYQALGVFVFFLGSLISIFLPWIIKDASCGNGILRLLYFINLAGTVSTYYLAYKRTLLIADQKSYFTALTDTIVYFVFTILQLIVLYQFPNYIVYLLLAVLKNVTANWILSIKCTVKYPYLTHPAQHDQVKEFQKPVFHFVKDVFCSKIGSYIYYSTDNLIISIIKGSLATGYLANYTLITGYVNALFSHALNSLQASFGNYLNTEPSTEKKEQMTRNYICAFYLVSNFCMVCLLFLIQPFIQLMFGQSYLLPNSTSILLSINTMLTLMIQLPAQLFVIYKLYRHDRKVVIFSASFNIIISVFGVFAVGIDGALIGTLITSLIYLFSRFYMISKYVYQHGYIQYVKQFLTYFLISFINVIVTFWVVSFFPGETIPAFAVRAVFVGVLAAVLPLMLLYRTKELQFLYLKLINRG